MCWGFLDAHCHHYVWCVNADGEMVVDDYYIGTVGCAGMTSCLATMDVQTFALMDWCF